MSAEAQEGITNAAHHGGDDVWDPPRAVENAVRIVELLAMVGDFEARPYEDRELVEEIRNALLDWISSLSLFKYDERFALALIESGIPDSVLKSLAPRLEELIVGTSIVLSEDRVSMTDAMYYTSLIRRVVCRNLPPGPVLDLIMSKGTLRDLASRTALIILYSINKLFLSTAPDGEIT